MQLTTAVANLAFYQAGEDEPFMMVPLGFGQSVAIPQKAHRVQLLLIADDPYAAPWQPAVIAGEHPVVRSAPRTGWRRWIGGKGAHR